MSTRTAPQRKKYIHEKVASVRRDLFLCNKFVLVVRGVCASARIQRQLEISRAYFFRILLTGRDYRIAVAGDDKLYVHRNLEYSGYAAVDNEDIVCNSVDFLRLAVLPFGTYR